MQLVLIVLMEVEIDWSMLNILMVVLKEQKHFFFSNHIQKWKKDQWFMLIQKPKISNLRMKIKNQLIGRISSGVLSVS